MEPIRMTLAQIVGISSVQKWNYVSRN